MTVEGHQKNIMNLDWWDSPFHEVLQWRLHILTTRSSFLATHPCNQFLQLQTRGFLDIFFHVTMYTTLCFDCNAVFHLVIHFPRGILYFKVRSAIVFFFTMIDHFQLILDLCSPPVFLHPKPIFSLLSHPSSTYFSLFCYIHGVALIWSPSASHINYKTQSISQQFINLFIAAFIFSPFMSGYTDCEISSSFRVVTIWVINLKSRSVHLPLELEEAFLNTMLSLTHTDQQTYYKSFIGFRYKTRSENGARFSRLRSKSGQFCSLGSCKLFHGYHFDIF